MKQVFTFKEKIGRIHSPSDIFNKIKNINIDFNKEHFIVITLNTKNELINTHIVSVGILNSAITHPRETFRPALFDNANSIIIAHNHPSGDVKPSVEDKNVYEIMKNAGEILGIKVLDSIIFSKEIFYSMNE